MGPWPRLGKEEFMVIGHCDSLTPYTSIRMFLIQHMDNSHRITQTPLENANTRAHSLTYESYAIIGNIDRPNSTNVECPHDIGRDGWDRDEHYT